jgi:transposase
MTTNCLPYGPRQWQLLPAALQDRLPEGHLAYYIGDTGDSLDPSAFHVRYAGGGPRNQPLHPVMMVKVLITVPELEGATTDIGAALCRPTTR